MLPGPVGGASPAELAVTGFERMPRTSGKRFCRARRSSQSSV